MKKQFENKIRRTAYITGANTGHLNSKILKLRDTKERFAHQVSVLQTKVTELERGEEWRTKYKEITLVANGLKTLMESDHDQEAANTKYKALEVEMEEVKKELDNCRR